MVHLLVIQTKILKHYIVFLHLEELHVTRNPYTIYIYIPHLLKWILALVLLAYSKDSVIIHFDCCNLHTLKHQLTLQKQNCTNSS